MTPRERVMAVLRGEPVDKIPFTIYEGMIPQCSVERQLRNDGLCIVNRQQPVCGVRTPGCRTETHTYAEDGKPRVKRVTYTPVGEVSEVREPAGFTSWAVEKLFKGPEDYSVLKHMVACREYFATYDRYVTAEQWMGEDVILRGGIGLTPLHEIMISWMGVETFAFEWLDRRDEVLELERVMRESRRGGYPILADSPITHANYGGNEVPEVMGVPRFKEFCVPCYEECAELFRPKGKLQGTHLDGNNRPWAAAVAAAPLDYIEAFTPAPDTDMSLAEALDAWPDKVLWINFPSSLHLASLEVIRETTRDFVALGRETNRVIIGITEDIPKDRWQESLLAISEVVDENPLSKSL
ncbi:MAG: hypothetical protein HON70_02315 [Lentisphaerae bacterium]|nr:hypothetical protein [Lentisphaerota bacterium]